MTFYFWWVFYEVCFNREPAACLVVCTLLDLRRLPSPGHPSWVGNVPSLLGGDPTSDLTELRKAHLQPLAASAVSSASQL